MARRAPERDGLSKQSLFGGRREMRSGSGLAPRCSLARPDPSLQTRRESRFSQGSRCEVSPS
jgi:hypothetical protein